MQRRGEHVASMQLVIILCRFDDGLQTIASLDASGRWQMAGRWQRCRFAQQIILVRGAYLCHFLPFSSIFFISSSLLLSSFLFLFFFFLQPALSIDGRMFHAS